jgi:hypothetical protein
MCPQGNSNTDAAWLSSVRVVRCLVKSINERNLRPMLYYFGDCRVITRRKVEMTSSPHGSYALGYTDATMASTKGYQPARGSQSHKTGLSSDCRLKFAYMKLESLVNANQHVALNTFSGLVHTACQVMRVGNTRMVIGFDQKVGSTIVIKS